jgi:hypothetical protein
VHCRRHVGCSEIPALRLGFASHRTVRHAPACGTRLIATQHLVSDLQILTIIALLTDLFFFFVKEDESVVYAVTVAADRTGNDNGPRLTTCLQVHDSRRTKNLVESIL